MQKAKSILTDPKERKELIRYIVAGVLTTIVSIIVSYGCYMLLSADHTINGANTQQLMIGNTIAWIVAVIFAFWINRGMVFQVQGGTKQSKWKEFISFCGARLISWALFEEGFAALIKLFGITNVINRLIVLVLVTIFNYVASKYWIFKPTDAAAHQKTGAQEE